MKVTLNELIAAQINDSFEVNGRDFTAVFDGNYVAVDYSSEHSSEDIEDEHLLQMEADNMEEFKVEIMNLLACSGFNEWNTTVHDNDNASGGMDLGWIPGKGYLEQGIEDDNPAFVFPYADNSRDMFVCEVQTPESTCCTLTITLSQANLKADVEYEVMKVASHGDYEDNPGSYCDFGAWMSDKCYYKLWKRYLALTHKDC